MEAIRSVVPFETFEPLLGHGTSRFRDAAAAAAAWESGE